MTTAKPYEYFQTCLLGECRIHRQFWKYEQTQHTKSLQLEFRRQALQIKIDLFTISVETGQLNMAQYLKDLAACVQRQRQLAVYFKNQNKVADALKIMRRVKIMTTEIAAAGDGSS